MSIHPLLITKDSKLIAFQYKNTHPTFPTKQAFFKLELLKVTLAHHAELKNEQSTTCFSTVLNPALFGKNSLAVRSKDLNNISLWCVVKQAGTNNVTFLAKYSIFFTSSFDDKLPFESFFPPPYTAETNNNFYLHMTVCCNPLFNCQLVVTHLVSS